MWHKIYGIGIFICWLMSLMFAGRVEAAQSEFQRSMKLCDSTKASVRVVAPQSQKRDVLRAISYAMTGAKESCARLRDGKQDNQTGQLNMYAGQGPVPLSLDLQFLLPRTVRLAKLTNGAFDPVVARSSYRDLWLDPSGKRAMLRKKGAAISFRGLLNGYLADRIAARLRAKGLYHYSVEVGGNAVKAAGRGLKLSWMGDVPDPIHPQGESVCRVALMNRALATSGGKGLSFSGSTAYASVSVLSRHAFTAQALANAAMVMGPRAATLIRQMSGTDAVFISHQGQPKIVGSVPAACLF